MSEEGSKERPHRPPPPSPSPSAPLPANAAEEFEQTYRDAYQLIDKGINLITEGHKAQAHFLLQQGLTLIDKALEIKVEALDCDAVQVQKFCEMQIKMRSTRKEVLCHFADAQASDGSGPGLQGGSVPALPDPPPSYDEYLQSLQSSGSEGETTGTNTAVKGGSVSYPTLDNLSALGAGGSGATTPILSPQNGEMIFQVESGVQIFFIYPDGRVTSPSYPAFLAIFTFPEPIGGSRGVAVGGMNGARGFLQVGEWSYPLIPAHSPVLHSFYGAYMFPDVTSSIEGASVGVILPDSVEKEQREMFEQILTQLTQYQEQEAPPGVDAAQETSAIMAASTSERIAAGAEAVSQGVVWGAAKLSELITFGTESLKTHLQPELEKREVDPKWQKTAQVARKVSGSAVKVSGFLLGQVGKATMALGRKVAPHLQHQGTRALSHLTGQSQKEASSNMDGVMEVAVGAVKGASTIYIGLETAAATLATNITQNTVDVVSHKYGEAAGSLTDDTLHAVGQTAWAGHNLASLGVKGVAKRAAKDTGKALVHHHEAKKKQVEVGEEAMEVVEEASEASEAQDQQPQPPIREKRKPPL